MKSVDVFYQGEGILEIEHTEVSADENFSAVKALLVKKHGLTTDVLIFLEDSDDPIDETRTVREHAGSAGIKAHLHRCRHIEVDVAFNGETVHHCFGPGSTVACVKHWAAERKFGMSAEEGSEHVLQIPGSQDRPAPGTHLGALVTCPNCRLRFDLVPDQRVNGSPNTEVRQ